MTGTTSARRAAARFLRVRGDSGSIILALFTALIAAGLIVVVGASTLAAQRAVRYDRSYTLALQAADAGVQQALYRLSIRDSAEGPANERVPASGQFGPTTLNGATYTWFMQRIGATTDWAVTATGTRGDRTRRVLATVRPRKIFFAALFGTFGLDLNGGNTADTYNGSPTCASACTPAPGRLGVVGSNGDIRILGTSTRVDGVQLWDWRSGNNDFDARCDGQAAIGLAPSIQACSAQARANPVDDTPYTDVLVAPRVIDPSPAFVQAKYDACDALATGTPPNKTWGSSPMLPVTTASAALSMATGGDKNQVAPVYEADGITLKEPGYYCFNRVTFNQNVAPDPIANRANPVVIYAKQVVINNDTHVNCVTDCDNAGDSPDATSLRIHIVGATATGNAHDFNAGNHSSLGGTVLAPAGSCGGGAHANIYGSMICNTVGSVGGWQFHFDSTLDQSVSKYSIAKYQEQTT